MLNIVLDSNVIINDWRMRGIEFQLLKWFIINCNAKLFVPQLVIDEVTNKAREKLQKSIRLANKNIKEVERIINKQTNSRISIMLLLKLKKEYRSYLLNFFDDLDAKLIAHDDIPHDVLIKRSLSRKKPFNNDDKGYRDSIIWETILQSIAICNATTIFITDNKNDFASNKNANILHDDLLDDLKSKELSKESVILCDSLQSFNDKYVRPELEREDHVKDQIKLNQYPHLNITNWLNENTDLIISEIHNKIDITCLGYFDDHKLTYIDSIDFPSKFELDKVKRIDNIDILVSFSVICEIEAYFWIGGRDELPESNMLPLEFDLMVDTVESLIKGVELRIPKFYGNCLSCGHPVMSDAAETCTFCGVELC